jgi:hypothetical protein
MCESVERLRWCLCLVLQSLSSHDNNHTIIAQPRGSGWEIGEPRFTRDWSRVSESDGASHWPRRCSSRRHCLLLD